MSARGRIIDYVYGIVKMRCKPSPIGAVVFDESTAQEATVAAAETGLMFLHAEEDELALVEKARTNWEKGNCTIVEVGEAVPPKLQAEIDRLFHGENRYPAGSALILLQKDKFFDSSSILQFVDSVCRV